MRFTLILISIVTIFTFGCQCIYYSEEDFSSILRIDSMALSPDRYPDMLVDISARICHLQYQPAKDRNRVRDFCMQYHDRLLYGTDVSCYKWYKLRII